MRHNGKRVAYKRFSGDYMLARDGDPYGLDMCECETCRKARIKSINEHMERAGRA